MKRAQQRNSEPSPPKTIFHHSENHLTCPSKHKRQRQYVKLERVMPLKKHEFKKRRPSRGASRKNYFAKQPPGATSRRGAPLSPLLGVWWAPAFASWPIFKMVSFLEYVVFFGANFCTQQLEMICRMDFDMFFRILIVDPKWGFCKGYSLCMMADFQNGLIFRTHIFFWSNFLPTTTQNDL